MTGLGFFLLLSLRDKSVFRTHIRDFEAESPILILIKAVAKKSWTIDSDVIGIISYPLQHNRFHLPPVAIRNLSSPELDASNFI